MSERRYNSISLPAEWPPCRDMDTRLRQPMRVFRAGLGAIMLWIVTTGFGAYALETAAMESDGKPLPQSAPEWLAAVRRQLPREPTWIKGWLSTDNQPMLNIDILLDLGRDPPTARYTLRDAFGRDLEEATLRREADRIRLDYRRGAPLEEAPAPDLFAPIRNTAMSWGDLNLAFLWWQGGAIIGYDEVRGQECVVIEVVAPDQETGLYDLVRIWIDRKHRMLLQAEGYNARGDRIRRMQVRSFRKIGEEWMVKDIVIRRYPGILRTNLRVRDMGTRRD